MVTIGWIISGSTLGPNELNTLASREIKTIYFFLHVSTNPFNGKRSGGIKNKESGYK